MNLDLKGIWIPMEVLTDEKLRNKEKVIYSLILFLSKERNFCFCNNKDLSELLNISVTQVSKLVNSLKEKGYINIEIVYKKNSKEVGIRRLIPVEEKFKDNKYNKNKYKYKNNNKRYGDRNNKSSNFEQRDYSDFDFNKFYVNVN